MDKMKEEKKTVLRRLRRKIIFFKVTMQRGYSWISFLMMGIVVAISATPYMQSILPWIHMWMMAIFMVIVIFLIGWFDNKYRFMHAEADYGVEKNPLLLNGLKGKLRDEEKNE
jgi:membrane protein YdbS with pleckstrin-like domain